MEWLEFKVALKVIKEKELEDSVIILDGSLYGRMIHLPNDSPAEGQRGFMLQYFDTYEKLLNECRSRNIHKNDSYPPFLYPYS